MRREEDYVCNTGTEEERPTVRHQAPSKDCIRTGALIGRTIYRIEIMLGYKRCEGVRREGSYSADTTPQNAPERSQHPHHCHRRVDASLVPNYLNDP